MLVRTASAQPPSAPAAAAPARNPGYPSPLRHRVMTVPMTIAFALGGQWTHAVIMAVVSMIISTMDNIIRPLLVRGQLHLHPIWILLSVLGVVSVFGPPGIVVGPMVVVLIRTCLALMLEGSAAEAESSGEQG